MSLVQATTLAEYVGEDIVTGEMAAAIQRAEAIAAARIGCRELRSRVVTETIPAQSDADSMLARLSRAETLTFPVVFVSDGPIRSVNSMSITTGSVTHNVLPSARVSSTGWAVRYRFPFGFGFTVDMPYLETNIDIEYVAGWHTEADLPNGIRQFIIAQATQTYATPIGGVIKVRLGDNYVDLNPDAIARQVDQYAEMLDQWVRVRL
jgi:hypothetical protein